MNRKWIKRLTVYDGLVLLLLAAPMIYAVDAPTGFDNLTNGFEAQANMDADRAVFEEREQLADGLGPVYNAQSCTECHQNPVTGATSQVTELRAGILDSNNNFTNPVGGRSLINDRAIDPSIQMHGLGVENVATFRTSLNTLGDGFVEALPDSSFTNTRNAQPSGFKGQIITVPVGEAGGALRTARFGWKNQHASLMSFAADAYLNEMGITSPLQPTENNSGGNSVAAFDHVADPEDPATTADPFGADIGAFTRFMRSTKPPSRDATIAATSDAITGASLFHSIGCDICHTPNLTTAAAGTSFNGGHFVVPAALGTKVIHPYSDFMLHDVGTGDFIVQNGGASTLTKLRTPPLWGMRTRSRLMHDGENITRNFAILRHTNEAEPVIDNYINLSLNQQNQLIAFLTSL